MFSRKSAVVLIGGVLGILLVANARRSPERTVRRILSRAGSSGSSKESCGPEEEIARGTSAPPPVDRKAEERRPTQGIRERLGVTEEIADRIRQLLEERNRQAAELFLKLDPEEEVTACEVKALNPYLERLDDSTDLQILALLDEGQRSRYRRLRREGVIPGTAWTPRSRAISASPRG